LKAKQRKWELRRGGDESGPRYVCGVRKGRGEAKDTPVWVVKRIYKKSWKSKIQGTSETRSVDRMKKEMAANEGRNPVACKKEKTA